MKIEAQTPTIRRKEMDAVLTAMVDDQIGPGEKSKLLLQIAKEQLKFDFALALRSPATALHIALKSLGLKENDAVLLSALSPRYYLNALEDLHLRPVFCDVSFSFPCIDCQSIEKAIYDNTTPRCILLHHTLGYVPDTSAIINLGIPVIEDISQSYCHELDNQSGDNEIPAKVQEEYRERAHGIFTILGLEERDMLTSGGGALLLAMNRKDGAALRDFSNIPPEYCLPDINAALASAQFKEAVRNALRRREIAGLYNQASLKTRHKKFVPVSDFEYCNYSFSLVLESGMKEVSAYARKKEIVLENAFEQTAAGTGMCDSVLCPVSYSLSLRTALFPLYPRLSNSEAQRVSKLIMTLP